MRFLTSVVVLLLAAFAGASTLNVGNGAEPKDLDPQRASSDTEFHLLINLFEGLVAKDPHTLKIIPGVAETWKPSDDKRVYTFKLRKNAKWSNGDAVTAKDFVFAWTRLLDPKTAAEYAPNGFIIKNGKDFNSGKIKDANQLGVKAVDDYTLQVTLEKPTPYFMMMMNQPAFYPVHKKSVEQFDNKFTRAGNLVTNGPYQLTKWELNRIISGKKNPNYWDAANVKIDEVNWYPLEVMDTEEKMFRTGKLHVTNEAPIEKIPSWKGKPEFHQHPLLAVYFYWFNVTKPPFKDNVKLRKAFALAIDRQSLVKNVTKGGQPPAQSFVVPGMSAGEHAKFQANLVLPTDLSRLAEAKKLMAEAGYPDGKGLPKIELMYNTSANHKKIAEAVQAMFKKNLNVNISLVNQEWKVFLDSLRTRSFTMGRMTWMADYNDPWAFLSVLRADTELNQSGWKDPKYEALMEQASNETNEEKRAKLLSEAEKVALDQLPMIPVYFFAHNYFVSTSIENWSDNFEDIHPIKFLNFKTAAK